MDAERDWPAELEHMAEPEDEAEYWESQELTAQELTQWSDMDEAADDALAGRCAGSQADGSIPDLIAAVLGAAGDTSLMTDADPVNSLAGWHWVAFELPARIRSCQMSVRNRFEPRLRPFSGLAMSQYRSARKLCARLRFGHWSSRTERCVP